MKPSPLIRLFACSWLAVVGLSLGTEPTQEGIAFFEKKIRPMLVQHCYKCHSANSEKVRGELLVDTKTGLL